MRLGFSVRERNGPALFDRRRPGTMLGEGAGVLVLEAGDHARQRGAKCYGQLAGYAAVGEHGGFIVPDPVGKGVCESLIAALAMAGTRRVGWIKAHGTGARLNDLAEAGGLARLLDGSLPDHPLTSLTSTVGHCLGACGGVEAVAAIAAHAAGVVPGTVGTEVVDPALPPCSVATEPRPAPQRDLLLLFESFGGRTVSLVLRAA